MIKVLERHYTGGPLPRKLVMAKKTASCKAINMIFSLSVSNWEFGPGGVQYRARSQHHQTHIGILSYFASMCNDPNRMNCVLSVFTLSQFDDIYSAWMLLMTSPEGHWSDFGHSCQTQYVRLGIAMSTNTRLPCSGLVPVCAVHCWPSATDWRTWSSGSSVCWW